MAEIKPFSAAVDDKLLDDLKWRLCIERWPGEPQDACWPYGAGALAKAHRQRAEQFDAQ